MTHTKGPWAINGSTYTGYMEAESIMSGDGREVLYATHDGTFVIENSSVAHLITAAPELLEALRGLYNAIDSCVELTPDVMETARAAIAKAEGKA